MNTTINHSVAEHDTGLHTLPEVARFLRVSDWTVSRLVASGDLPSLKINARRLVKHEDLIRFVDDRQAETMGAHHGS